MSAHRHLNDLEECLSISNGMQAVVPDPGNAGTINVKALGFSVCLIDISDGGDETRVLPSPLKLGVGTRLIVFGDSTQASSCTITDGNSNAMVVGYGYGAEFVVLTLDNVKIWVGHPFLSSLAGVTSSAAELNLLDGVTATMAEINRGLDVSTRIVNATSSTLTVTEASHSDKIIVLDRAAGIAVTLPAAAAGLRFRFIVKTTFSGAASIKSVSGADIMIGHALMGNNSDNTVVDWPAIAANTFDTIDLLGTANSTGGMAGQEIEIIGLAANLWLVSIRGDAAGTEATPFADTVT